MDALPAVARRLAERADEHGRKKLLNDLRYLAYSVESPDDSVQRIMTYVIGQPCLLPRFFAHETFRDCSLVS